MNKFMLSILGTFALCAATAFAQYGAQGTQRSSPTTGSPNAQQQQPGMNQPGANQPGQDQTTPTAQTDQNTPNANHNEATGKSLKGCVESQGGQYMLETKKGSIPLTGQDVSAHVGHEVKVKGMWEKGTASSSATSTESTSTATSGKSFNVSSVDMVSETCKMKSKGSSTGGTGTGTSNQPQ